MLSIVSFVEENIVKAVPAHLIKNNLCGLSNMKIKSIYLICKTMPNKFDFHYLKSRVLKKGIGKYLINRKIIILFFY